MQKNQVFLSILFALGFFLFGQFVFAAKGAPYILINDGDERTTTRKVDLTLSVPKGMTAGMRMASTLEGLESANWLPFSRHVDDWLLPAGINKDKIVYVQYRNSAGKESQVYSAVIYYDVPNYKDFDFEINSGADETRSRYVTINLSHEKGLEGVEISNSSRFTGDWQKASLEMPWVLSAKSGKKKVYVKFLDANDKTRVISKEIEYTPAQVDIEPGTVVKGVNTAMYYLGNDARLHSFSHPAVFHSWYEDYSEVFFVSDAKIRQFEVGDPVCFRPGSFLLKFTYDSKVYAVEPGCQLRPLFSGVEAELLYGKTWESRIIELPSYQKNFYNIKSMSLHNPDKDIRDRDHDGVDEETEKEYNSSDVALDSDKDGLSDYEEIFVWFTDPSKTDTDGDGFTDSAEILNGFSPVGSSNVTSIPDGALRYPLGSIVSGNNDRSYRSKHQKHFIVSPKYTLSKSLKNKLSTKNTKVPTRFVGDRIVEL